MGTLIFLDQQVFWKKKVVLIMTIGKLAKYPGHLLVRHTVLWYMMVFTKEFSNTAVGLNNVIFI